MISIFSMEERKFVRLFLLVPSLIVLYFVIRIFQPFIVPLCTAVVLGSLAFPGYRWLSKRLKGRDSLASLISCLLLTIGIVVPMVLLIISLADQTTQVYRNLEDAVDRGEFERMIQLEQSRLEFLREYLPIESVDLGGLLVRASQQLSLFFVRSSTAILSGIAQLITSFLVMLFALFFLFRDGEKFLEQVKTYSPLSTKYFDLITGTFLQVTNATILGSLLTALAQGVAGGLTFLVLGLPNSLLWGSLTALFSLVPVVGTSVVWAPWSIYLLLSGSITRGMILIVAGVAFVGTMDNFVRPLLIEGRAKMHTLVVFLSIMGGMSYFGMIGLLFGPILAALGLTFLELYKIEYQQELEKSD